MMQSLLHNLQSAFQSVALTCNDGNFFSFPTWYRYLPGRCTVNGIELPDGFSLFDAAPLVGLAVLDILLRVAGLVAIFFVVYGGVLYVVSQGEPDKVATAKGTIINALAGLLIATFAIAIVAFVGRSVG
jgi:hypothetical protein